MPTENETLPAVSDEALQRGGLPSRMEMSPGLAIFFDDALYARCKNIAKLMSEASSMMPAHLREKPAACFAVVSRAIVWKLDPFSVAMATYQTPGGSIGYLGTLIQAILERSGQLDGGVTFTHNGDWSKVKGKFKLKAGKNGGEFPVPTWTPEDAAGLSVTVSAKVKGELDPRTLVFDLIEAFPLNSPLWATAPSRQVCYTAVRAFGNLACPSLLMGVPFDVDPNAMGGDMQDITPPQPKRTEFVSVRDKPELQDWIAKANFASSLNEIADLRDAGTKALHPDHLAHFMEVCDARARQIADKQPPAQIEGESTEQRTEEPVAEKVQTDEEKTAPPAEEKQTVMETPFQRGLRLLPLCVTPADVNELALSIAEELKGKDLKLWKETCMARFAEVGGKGKMAT